VVDDDPALARLSTLALQIDGYEVQAFSSPVEALAQLADASVPNPKAIVLDLNMPQVDGREFYKRARALGYTDPVLILSAYGAEAAQHELGADAALAKPFDPEELSSTLKGILPASS
jgi:DNA-binding response OmpR family regulator